MPVHTYADHLVWGDDYTGYASDSAFEAAYPFDPPGDMSFSGVSGDTDWGATNGPDGQPGILGNILAGGGGFDKFPLSPQGRTFSVHGRFNCTGATFFDIAWAPSGDRNSDFYQPINVQKTGGNALQVTVRTTVAYQTVGTPPRWVGTGGSLVGNHDIRIDFRLSLITETSPGVFAPDGTGWMDAFVDGALVMSFDGAVWGGRSDLNPTPYWNFLTIRANTKVTNVAVYDLLSESTSVDQSNPCCSTAGNAPQGGDSTTGTAVEPDPFRELPEWSSNCTGGGTVPSGTPITNSEVWAY